MGMVLGLLLVTSLVEEAERGFGGPLQHTLLPGMSCLVLLHFKIRKQGDCRFV